MMSNFITNIDEFNAAQQQVIDYVNAGRRDNEAQMTQLIDEMKLFILRSTGHNTVLHDMAQLPEGKREEAVQEFIKKNLNRTLN